MLGRAGRGVNGYVDAQQGVCEYVQTERREWMADRNKSAGWGAFVALIVFEIVMAFIVKGTHIEGTGAFLLYLVPVLAFMGFLGMFK